MKTHETVNELIDRVYEIEAKIEALEDELRNTMANETDDEVIVMYEAAIDELYWNNSYLKTKLLVDIPKAKGLIK